MEIGLIPPSLEDVKLNKRPAPNLADVSYEAVWALCCEPCGVGCDMPVGLLLVIRHVRQVRASAVKRGKEGYDA